MSIAREEVERLALILIKEHHESFEFSNIYEDEEFATDLTEDEQRDLFDIVTSARVSAVWERIG